MAKEIAILEKYRRQYQPKLPWVFAENGAALVAVEGPRLEPESDRETIKQLFPHTYGMPVITFEKGQPYRRPINVGVILSGGQAPGGHNVIAGLFDGIKSLDPRSKLYGFIGGPIGVIKGNYKELTAEIVDEYRNTGGFDIIGSGRDKIESADQMEAALETCKKLGIEGLVIVGGDDSNTNACVMAEYYVAKGEPLKVIGVPKTIDGDLKNKYIETSFGFDTATKVYSELIGNVARDANSSRKYYHFIKLMGRTASHITLECALQTHPNIALIGEEAAAKKQTLRDIVEYIVGIVVRRSALGKNFGIVLIPEGIIEFLPDIKGLIKELNALLATASEQFVTLHTDEDRIRFVSERLSPEAKQVFCMLPREIQAQLLLDRDPHGNVQVSRIESEKLIAQLVERRLKELKSQGKFNGKFSSMCHFFGYEGRSCQPTNFDADYCYSLGYCAAALLAAGKTGYIANIRGLNKPASEWQAGGVPLTAMLNIEFRKGKNVPVIKKALVDLNGKPFAEFAVNRERWALEECYLYPGPIQYFGPPEVCDRPPRTLELELG